MKFPALAAAVFNLCLLLGCAAAATGRRTGGDRERTKRFALSVPGLIACEDSVDCVFKITEFATYRLSIRTYSLLKRVLGLDAERRALQTALKEAELDALRDRHAAEILRMERTLHLLALEADSESSEMEATEAKDVDKEGSTLHFF